jgi:hypothetical protein
MKGTGKATKKSSLKIEKFQVFAPLCEMQRVSCKKNGTERQQEKLRI